MAGEWRFNLGVYRTEGDRLMRTRALPVCDNAINEGRVLTDTIMNSKVDAMDVTETQKQNETKPFKYNQYATKKTLAQGLLDVGLLMANASQLKALISLGPNNQDYFWPNIALVALSIVLQVIVGIMLLVLGSMEVKTPEEKRHVHKINDTTVGLIFVITVLNVFIGAFGIKLSDA